LKDLPDECVDMLITSPPYWALRDYGIEPQIWGGSPKCKHKWGSEKKRPINLQTGNPEFKRKWREAATNKKSNTGAFCKKCGAWRGCLGLEPTFDLFINHLCDIFDEAKRILKKHGTCWVNLGDTYFGGGYGSKTNLKKTKQFTNHGTINGRETMQAIRKNGNGYPKKSLCLIPQRFAIEMVNRGWILRNEIIWHKPSCMPSSIKDRFTVDFEYLFFFSKSQKYYFEQQFEDHKKQYLNRYNYQFSGIPGAASPVEKRENPQAGNWAINPNGRNMRSVWSISPQPFPEAHFATFPEKLIETPIKAGCPEFVCKKCGKPRAKIFSKKFVPQEDVSTEKNKRGERGKPMDDSNGWQGFPRGSNKVSFKGYTKCGCNAGFKPGVALDLFMGTGTTALVSLKNDRDFLGVEVNPKYIEMANKRIKPYLEQTKLQNY
jgi:DNA modification methylase